MMNGQYLLVAMEAEKNDGSVMGKPFPNTDWCSDKTEITGQPDLPIYGRVHQRLRL